jgi:Icc-related predicted phosphoesterase
VKVLAVSDRVQQHIYSETIRDLYSDVGIVFSCGDLPFYYLEYIVTMLTVPLLYVRGNHDDRPEHTSTGRVISRPQGCVDVDGWITCRAQLLVGGIEGSMRYRPDGEAMYTDYEVALKLARMAPSLVFNKLRHGRYVDVLLTHAPPYGIHDDTDLAHTGFKPFLPFMRLFRPRYLLHGHVHSYDSRAVKETRYQDTFVINVYSYAEFDIPLVGKGC